MKKLLIVIITLVLLTTYLVGCDSTQYGNTEFEVISVSTYTIITGRNDNGPVEETRLAFIYMNNGNPELVKDYYESDSVRYATYILIGDSNKYVVVNEYRDRTQYLYLTQETYNELFPEGENNG